MKDIKQKDTLFTDGGQDDRDVKNKKAKELTKEYQGKFWKIYDKETNTIYEWNSFDEEYKEEY